MDTRNRPAAEIIDDLRAMKGCKLAVLGSLNIDAAASAAAIHVHQKSIIAMIGWHPVRLITGCRPVGAEKAARLAAKRFTGKLAAVIHRAEITYGIRTADMMANMIIEQASDALLILTSGPAVCDLLRARFEQNGKKVFEIEIS